MKRFVAFFTIATCFACKPTQPPASAEPASPDLSPSAEQVPLAAVSVEVTPTGSVEGSPSAAPASASGPLAAASLPAPPGKLSAQLCSIAGKGFTPSQLVGANQRTLAADGNGALYVPDDTAVRRYLVEGDGSACTLTLDKKFGRNGSVNLKFQVYRLSVDPSGSVLACGWSECSLITGKQVLPACDAPFGRRKRIAEEPEDQRKERKREPHGMLALTAFGGVGGGVNRMRTLMGVEIVDSECKVEAYSLGDDFAISAVARFDDLFYVTGRNAMGESKLYIHDVKKGRQGEVLSEEPPSKRAMCWVNSIVACGAGLCMLDTRCNRVTVIDRKGAFVSGYALDELLGTPNLRPAALAPAGAHEHFLLAHEPAVAEPRIYRIANLPGAR